MYLKELEMVGFKSFADKTKLEFEPGMTAIVGPNGCGKSNVSDAIRWVIGETSAKALRGSKMEDCIFSGTDDRKPLGMAEVSITFADCEHGFETEYNEITVTRRVFRSGEGQYFINRTPCRLKDIQRLFMDTGVGTTSYSVMEQGRIDQILSSRPEDRRTVFEEASGITKFKADKKEAIRKLEHTEANLLRLADVIREVKRQIGSLQRQAGKARRYKVFRDELRKLEIFATQQNVTTADGRIREIEDRIAELNAALTAAHQEVEDREQENGALRAALMQTEREIGSVMEAGVHARSRLDHTRELIEVNRQRIEEYQSWSERDTRAIEEARTQIETQRATLEDLARQETAAEQEQQKAELTLQTSREAFEALQTKLDAARAQLQDLRTDSVEMESLASRLQNQLLEIDSKERSRTIQHERLAAEKSRLTREVNTYEERVAEMGRQLGERRVAVERAHERVKELEGSRTEATAQLRTLETEVGEQVSKASAVKARVEMLRDREAARGDFPAGAQYLMSDDNPLGVGPDAVLGSIASHLDVEPEYAVAVEAVLRAWLDAVVVSDSVTAMEILKRLESGRHGPGRLLPLDAQGGGVPAGIEGDLLASHVRCAEEVAGMVRALIGNAQVVNALDDIPSLRSANDVWVTRSGCVVRGSGGMEFWMRSGQEMNPLSRENLAAGAEQELVTLESLVGSRRSDIAQLHKRSESLEEALAEARRVLDGARHALAQKEGENEIISRECRQARERLETVTWELSSLEGEEESGGSRREAIFEENEAVAVRRKENSQLIADCTKTLESLEERHSELQTDVTEHRILYAEVSQKVQHLHMQRTASRTHLHELENAIAGRSQGLQSYEAGIADLTAAIEDAESRLSSLEEAVEGNQSKANALRLNREKQAEELQEMERLVAERRDALEEVRNDKSQQEIRCTESRMQRDNILEKVTTEYRLTAEEIMQTPEPEWGDEGRPSQDALETSVTELKTKIEAMGPVNLVAIEEYQELQERHDFLTQQEEDLVKAKEQLLTMIRKINRTTSELFRTTFEQVNENFQQMFKQLFNGGSAKLILVNEEDVLECGIEIIARPPGKRLQNISLLSGGERTLTAVSLLFAIYMIKPSPFCLLDELDAALDDSNIGRFVNILKGFLEQSQFVVITHSRQTIAAADILYGVTMPEKGISKLVSMRFQDHATAEEKG